MERIKRFLCDDSGTAEATSTVIMVAGVGVLLGGALVVYYGAVNGFFTSTKATLDTYASELGPKF